MNYLSLGLAALASTVAYFAFGFLLFWLAPALINESRKYPDVFRSKEKMMSVMPIGMAATFVAILVVAILFAMSHSTVYTGGSVAAEGAIFGALIGLFAVCAFVLHNYVNLNIGLKLALVQAAAYFVQWTIVGIVIALIYKPLSAQ
jgi:Protein of unknown function (DUF1761)